MGARALLGLAGLTLALALPAAGLSGCTPRSAPTRDATVSGPPDLRPSFVDPDVDHDGDNFTINEGDCDDGIASAHPGAPELCNGMDDDCDRSVDETCDYDQDNYSGEAGDCDDHQELQNPGAYEVAGNEVDDDCDGLVDEVVDGCDGPKDKRASSLAGAFELCPPWLVRSDWSHESDERSRAILPMYGPMVRPKAGGTFAVLSTGVAAAARDPGYVDPQPGSEFLNDARNPLPMSQQASQNICGMAYSDELTVHDYLELTYTLKVPTNAKSFSFQFYFLSSEYPEWVGSEFNDKFLVLLDSKAFKGNISFDQNKNPITVNVGFFKVCEDALICEGQKKNVCKTRVSELAGTGYELDDGSGMPIGGATGWLTTTAPVRPGETATLRFILFDEGDHILDSAVVIDNFRWQLTAAPGPTTIP